MSAPENPKFEPEILNIEPHPPVPVSPELLPSTIEQTPLSPAPTENPVWNGWDVIMIAGLTIITLFFVQLLIVLGARRYAFPGESWLQVAQKPVLALLSELVTYIAVALYMILLLEGKYRARFWAAIRWNWPGTAAISMLGLGVVMIGLDLLGRLFPMPKSTPFDQFFARPSDAYLTAIFAVTLGPLMEEFFFRGFLYPILARRMGAFWGIVLTAVPFGLIHMMQYGYAWGAVLVIFLVGIVLTTVRAVTKSVASSFLAHVGYNGTLMVLAAWATDGFRHMEKAGIWLF